MITIAIDGYSSTGKSTMARKLASNIGYRYIDSGAMYRAVTIFAINSGMVHPDGSIDTANLCASLDNIEIDFAIHPDGSQSTLLNGVDVEKDIREMTVSRSVSQVAAIPEVRTAMVALQRSMGRSGGVVMDGRDIGTTVFPDAALKIFVTASPEVRARRRYLELKNKGENVSLEEVLENVRQRDWLDEHRDVSPLRKAPDAIVVDNTSMTIADQNSLLLTLAMRAIEES